MTESGQVNVGFGVKLRHGGYVPDDALQFLFWLAVALTVGFWMVTGIGASFGNQRHADGDAPLRSSRQAHVARSRMDPPSELEAGPLPIEGRSGTAFPLSRRARHRFAALRVGSRRRRQGMARKMGPRSAHRGLRHAAGLGAGILCGADLFRAPGRSRRAETCAARRPASTTATASPTLASS